ncbi:hypothetical protein H2200_003758 [Cladophialophora chaetospira]|uniref:Uncharacterized protein n=1 Tax=Cladophialophora chaetospira TaxID=386627 RepID=A0AA38XF15_9EURO|nr:hypothetical protein H2200_003758 [Cladophialophora chaetospira]
MNDRYEMFPMWQVVVPNLSSDQPFLRHGLLALAAMHLRHTSPPPFQSRYFDLASQHQAIALSGYIPELRTITAQNCHALFAFSALLLPIQYSSIATINGEIDSEEVLAALTGVFDYVIGATIIAYQGDVWLRQGGLQPLLTRTTEPENILPYLLKEPQDALRNLSAAVDQLAHESGVDEGKVSIYVRSIDMLTNAFPTEDAQRRFFDDMIGWPHFVGGNLLRLLRERDPMALVILAHYGVALHAFRDFWWLEGVGARLIRGISRILSLSPEFLVLMQWPLSCIAGEEGTQYMYTI